MNSELLEHRYLLTAIQFVPRALLRPDAHVLEAIVTADFDGDGDVDIATASRGDGKLAWHDNVDGQMSEQILIHKVSDPWVHDLVAADIDGDLDIDLLLARSNSQNGEVILFENDGAGAFTRSGSLATSVWNKRVFIADFDSDEDLDIMYFGQGETISWRENNGRGEFETEHVIPVEDWQIETAAPADMDADGDMDVVVYLRENDSFGRALDGSRTAMDRDVWANSTLGMLLRRVLPTSTSQRRISMVTVQLTW